MSIKQTFAAVVGLLMLGQQAMAQDDMLSCEDIEWSSAVTDQYPSIADACNAVMEKNGQMFARVSVELQRVRGNNLTFKVLNRDGTSGGSYTQNVGNSWRAQISGRSYRARDLSRGQRLNVYLPPDRWAIIHEDEDGPDMEDAMELAAAPMLPSTASNLPLVGAIGAGFLMLGAAFTLMRSRRREVALNPVRRD